MTLTLVQTLRAQASQIIYLCFKNAPDFETRVDSGGNHQYDVTVSVRDTGRKTDSREVDVSVHKRRRGCGDSLW